MADRTAVIGPQNDRKKAAYQAIEFEVVTRQEQQKRINEQRQLMEVVERQAREQVAFELRMFCLLVVHKFVDNMKLFVLGSRRYACQKSGIKYVRPDKTRTRIRQKPTVNVKTNVDVRGQANVNVVTNVTVNR